MLAFPFLKDFISVPFNSIPASYVSFMKYLSIEKCVQDTEAAKSDELYDMMAKTENGERFLDFIIKPHNKTGRP